MSASASSVAKRMPVSTPVGAPSRKGTSAIVAAAPGGAAPGGATSTRRSPASMSPPIVRYPDYIVLDPD